MRKFTTASVPTADIVSCRRSAFRFKESTPITRGCTHFVSRNTSTFHCVRPSSGATIRRRRIRELRVSLNLCRHSESFAFRFKNQLPSDVPTLQFKGKPLVQNHHLVVPFSELEAVKSLGLSKTPILHDNLIIEGDNLKALKALLPTYH